jgi:aspartate/methionine/tyrosine aminotransferase
MRIPTFTLENWFVAADGRYDCSLSSSDCEPLSVADLLHADEVDEFRRVSLAYGDPSGDVRLRQAIASQYQSVTPEGVHVCTPMEAIYLFMRSVVRPGDQLVAQSPLFQPLYEVAAHIGAQLSWWRPDNEQTCEHAVDDLRRLVNKRTRLIVINFPHNPTGQVISSRELHEIVEVARRVGATILSDEIFRLLERPPCETLPAICDLYERGVSLSGLSKVQGLGGLRIGWLATRMTEMLRDVEQNHFYTSGPPNTLCQWLAVKALNKTQAIAARNRRLIADNLTRLRDFAEQFGNGVLTLTEPLASTMLVAEQHTDLTSEQLCQRLLEEERVFLVPGTMVGMGNQHLRFGLGRKDFSVGVQRLRAMLERL